MSIALMTNAQELNINKIAVRIEIRICTVDTFEFFIRISLRS
jgi:hypothetical protein